MSCLMMNERPLASLADWIAALLNQGYNGFGMEAPESLYTALDDCRSGGRFDEGKIYLRLYALNAAAYDSRYSRYGEPLIFLPPEPYRPNTIHKRPEYKEHYIVAPWMYQIAKRLAFLTYQCCEDKTCDTELYKALVQLLHDLHRFIVEQSDAWQALRWME